VDIDVKGFRFRHDTRALQAYLGHRNIQHTVRYTELFKDFWRD
jgi:site-specific recombinase XerD